MDVAGALQVSFFLILSATEKHCHLRLVRSPRGPTLTFRVNSYSLASDVSATARKPYSPSDSVWQTAPMLVLSNLDKIKAAAGDAPSLKAIVYDVVCGCS